MLRSRIVSALLGLTLVLGLASCGENPNLAGGEFESEQAGSKTASANEASSASKIAVNPLTGVEDLDPALVNARPTAIMVNNIKVAWSVQTGLQNADIVYETFVEGGITRLMAVFQNIAAAPNIGTVRSARYSYAELVHALDAVYVSEGADKDYFAPYRKTLGVDWFNLQTHGAASFRLKNGKATEHTLYTSGEKLSAAIKKEKLRTSVKDRRKGKTVYNFAPDGQPVSLSGGAANTVKVLFSGVYNSTFTYDSQSGTYLKSQGGSAHKDYRTGEQLKIKNVFVLFSKITEFSDQYHVKTDLTSGSGYYAVNGTYEEIKWSKGSAENLLKFTKNDGSELTVNPGNSWVSITDINRKAEFSIS